MGRKNATAIRVLLFLKALSWVAVAVWFASENSSEIGQMVETFVVTLLLMDATAYAVLGFLWRKPRPSVLWSTVALLGLNILLTLPDQYGTADHISLLTDIAILTYILIRSSYEKSLKRQRG